jgi:EAL domain-containing protein (putative c-di-GMP-specific phosphodiesterase class I)/FixJ family two-component response regulator
MPDDVDARERLGAAGHQRAEPGRRATVLLVDDDTDVLGVYAEILREHGHEVDTFSDGFSAISRLRERSYDVIVSDIAMAGMDGLQFLRAVRELDLDVPVILNTGNPALDTAVRAVEEGAFRYLVKPISAVEFEETVRRAAGLHALARLKRQSLELSGQTAWALGDRAALEGRFAHAIESLWMAFQPIVSLGAHRAYAYEALVRSREATLGSPGDMFSAAERLGRVHDLGRVIRKSVSEAVPSAPADTLVFVNIHPLSLNDEELYAPRAPLSRHARQVVIEITERASLDGVQDTRLKVTALKALGFRVAVDDLGAGYAGLGALAQMEPDIVKIDMSLVRGVDGHPTKQTVIRSMASLCHDLGMTLVAEGVETRDECDTLARLGCDLLQGFLFGRPGPGFAPPQW